MNSTSSLLNWHQSSEMMIFTTSREKSTSTHHCNNIYISKKTWNIINSFPRHFWNIGLLLWSFLISILNKILWFGSYIPSIDRKNNMHFSSQYCNSRLRFSTSTFLQKECRWFDTRRDISNMITIRFVTLEQHTMTRNEFPEHILENDTDNASKRPITSSSWVVDWSSVSVKSQSSDYPKTLSYSWTSFLSDCWFVTSSNRLYMWNHSELIVTSP